MPERVIWVVALLALATGVAVWWQSRQGRVREVAHTGALSSEVLGHKRGDHASLVQFSTPMCAKCPPTARLLSTIASQERNVVHMEIDAAERLDLARELNILRTPTVLVLDGAGLVVARMDGAPTVHQVREALAAVPPDTDYSI